MKQQNEFDHESLFPNSNLACGSYFKPNIVVGDVCHQEVVLIMSQIPIHKANIEEAPENTF